MTRANIQRRTLAGLFGGLLMLPALAAADDLKLEWRFAQGDKWYIESTTVRSDAKKIGEGPALVRELRARRLVGFTVLRVYPDEIHLDVKIESIQVRDNLVAESHWAKGLAGHGYKLILNDRREVKTIEGYAESLKKAAKNYDAIARYLGTMFSEDQERQWLRNVFAFAPVAKVAKGDTWERRSVIPYWFSTTSVPRISASLGTLQADRSYTYCGLIDNSAAITFKEAGEFTPNKELDNLGVTKVSFTHEGGEGALSFDPKVGRLIQSMFRFSERCGLTQAGSSHHLTSQIETSDRVLLPEEKEPAAPAADRKAIELLVEGLRDVNDNLKLRAALSSVPGVKLVVIVRKQAGPSLVRIFYDGMEPDLKALLEAAVGSGYKAKKNDD